MELLDAIRSRRAVRDYLPDAVVQSVLEELIEAATWAPSAINEQPWSFTVVRDQALLDRISGEAKRHVLSTMWRDLEPRLLDHLGSPAFQIFYHAPALILISAVAAGPWAVEDCALAAQNLMLAARDKGLGTCWIGFAQRWLATPQGKRLLGLPDTCVPVAPVIVGHPKSAAPTPARLKTRVRWIGADA